jgi:signal transduction histidine kinase
VSRTADPGAGDSGAPDPRVRGQRHRWHRRFHQRLRHSLRWRLVALFLLLAAGTTLVFFVGTQRIVADGFSVLVKPLLSDYVDRLAGEIGTPPDVARARSLVQRLPISIRIDGPLVQWMSQPPRRVAHEGDEANGDDGNGRTLLTRTTTDGHRIQFGISRALWRDRRPWPGWIPLVGLLLLTWAAYATVRRLLRPLDDIRSGALRYGEGDFSQVIPVRRRDELGDLASQVNAMATGLQGMLQSQRALLLAISHELRSPLTRARLNAELLAEAPERTALLRDVALMGQLITDLLEGERLAAGSAALEREPTDLNQLVRDIIGTEFADQAVRLDLAEGTPTLPLDRPRVALLVRNLVDNACRHGAGAAEPVTVSTRVDDSTVQLRVRDHGPGVSEEHLARLTEPFYRPDIARTRGAGGVGLGLYLCKLVAQSHGATLTLRNVQPGLEAQVRWPR